MVSKASFNIIMLLLLSSLLLYALLLSFYNRIEVVSKVSFGVYTCTASSSGFPDASKEFLLLQNGE